MCDYDLCNRISDKILITIIVGIYALGTALSCFIYN